jgi:hypothetical protein
MSVAGTLDVRVVLFGDDAVEVREIARTFIAAARDAAPYGASVREQRLYLGLPPNLRDEFDAAITSLLEESA